MAVVQRLSLLHHRPYNTVSEPRSLDKEGKKLDCIAKRTINRPTNKIYVCIIFFIFQRVNR